MSTSSSRKLLFSFDIGYSSIGWAVIQMGSEVEIIGSGVVLFPKDDCLASQRRMHRRMRRTIRARRQRIDRIGKILEHYGVITPQERRMPGHPTPFVLAAEALSGKRILTGLEVWHLMRWYAHNRGYDGNARWAKTTQDREEEKEEAQRVETAKKKMEEMGTATMAETMAALLGLKDGEWDSGKAFKTLNMAFPRRIVQEEVSRLLAASSLSKTVQSLIAGDSSEHADELKACGVVLPRRFHGSVLFGQLVPRFDNRIIARCPVTWAKEYAAAVREGMDEKMAKARADKYAKVPKADCREFYEYRFARILANIRVDGKSLPAEARRELMTRARQRGKFGKKDFRESVRSIAGGKDDNLYNFFQIHPDSEKALVLVPGSEREKATGRAPYARPVLRQVVEEILRGEDATRPALSSRHPEGEKKAQDGILYSLLDPESEVHRLQASRRVEEMSNNHLVRHRMLIFERLLRDMISLYADGDPERVKVCCIEVGRELSEFSGKTSKEISAELGKRMENFRSAVNYLQKNAPNLSLSAGLIRKCRIAMDLNRTCPYTGAEYSAYNLPELELEHIIPFADRNSNALSSLVLTWPEVNKMKGKRTGLQFVEEDTGKPVPGRENLTITTPGRYKDFVQKLDDRKGAPDDVRRKKTRKRLMLVGALPVRGARDENIGFTEGMMTQSSHLMKIAAHVMRGVCPNVRSIMIPGAVTAAVRASWKAWDALAGVSPGIVGDDGKLREKAEIRDITHLHHALDACILGLIPLLIPAGTNGIVWQALAMRRLSSQRQIDELRGELHLLGGRKSFKIDADGRLHLDPMPESVRSSLARALKEERVAFHVPSDMSGAHLEETTWGVIGREEGGKMIQLRQRKIKGLERKRETESSEKLVGISPHGNSKLREIKGVRIIADNYGLALTPKPVVIPHHNVYSRLREYGKGVKLIRKGQLIRLTKHKDTRRNRVWRVASVKNNKTGPALDLQIPSSARPVGKTCPDNWINVSVKSLQQWGVIVLSVPYTGIPADSK